MKSADPLDIAILLALFVGIAAGTCFLASVVQFMFGGA